MVGYWSLRIALTGLLPREESRTMRRRIVSLIGIMLLALTALPPFLVARTARADDSPPGNLFVKQAGPELRLHGKVFRFAGTNNYYLMYKSKFMVDDVLNAAAAN